MSLVVPLSLFIFIEVRVIKGEQRVVKLILLHLLLRFTSKSLQLLPVGPKIVDEGVMEVKDRIVGCFLISPHVTA